jgi:hypothetical protein
MSLQRGINLRALAEKMGQCSGAEVRGICTEAGTSSFPFQRIVDTWLTFPVLFRHVRLARTTTARYARGLRVCRGQGLLFLPILRFLRLFLLHLGFEEEPGWKYFHQQIVFIDVVFALVISNLSFRKISVI